LHHISSFSHKGIYSRLNVNDNDKLSPTLYHKSVNWNANIYKIGPDLAPRHSA
jgi:hypothetical protein